MEKIKINMTGLDSEVIAIELNEAEVGALYQLRKDNTEKIAELEKKVKDLEQSKKYVTKNLEAANNELGQAHTLLTALGIQEKTNEEEVYYCKSIPVVARIALFIAKK